MKIEINNFDLIKPFLDTYMYEDDYFYLQIIKRNKDAFHPDLMIDPENPAFSSSASIKSFCITSLSELEKKMKIITFLCDRLGARAYINLNMKSFQKTAFIALRNIAENIQNENYGCIKNAYESACGKCTTKKSKQRWIIDIDSKDEENLLINTLAIVHPFFQQDYFLAKIPTRNGCHILCEPFDTKRMTGFQIKRNAHTLLYASYMEN